MIINMVGGGVTVEGDGLNFTVVRYDATPTESDKAQENTIAVVTTAPISGYVLQAEQPTGTPGLVWIQTNDVSDVAFYIDKNNQCKVYPKTVSQYVDGAWEKKDSHIHQGGGWIPFGSTYLYNKGDECTSLTGGWVLHKEYVSSWTKNAESITLSNGWTDDGGAYVNTRTSNAIDLTNVKTIRVNCTEVSARRAIGVTQDLNDYFDYRASASKFTSGKMLTYVSTDSVVMELDVSTVSGPYYVVLAACQNDGLDPRRFTFDEVEMT